MSAQNKKLLNYDKTQEIYPSQTNTPVKQHYIAPHLDKLYDRVGTKIEAGIQVASDTDFMGS